MGRTQLTVEDLYESPRLDLYMLNDPSAGAHGFVSLCEVAPGWGYEMTFIYDRNANVVELTESKFFNSALPEPLGPPRWLTSSPEDYQQGSAMIPAGTPAQGTWITTAAVRTWPQRDPGPERKRMNTAFLRSFPYARFEKESRQHAKQHAQARQLFEQVDIPASSLTKHPGKAGNGLRHYAEIARAYTELVKSGDTTPRKSLAEQWGYSQLTIRDKLAAARKHKLLTGSPGKVGGELTPLAIEVLADRPVE